MDDKQVASILLVMVLAGCAAPACMSYGYPEDRASLLSDSGYIGDMPDLLAVTSLPESMRYNWMQVGRFIWDWLLANDHDYYNAQGQVVPKSYASIARAASGRDVKCGRFSRQWIRMVFHDCGTYSRFLKQYGCNGSIRKELPVTDPWLDFTKLNPNGTSFEMISKDVFDQFRTNGVLDPAVDVHIDPTLHHGNAGFASSIAFYYHALAYARSPAVGLWDASFADILAYAGLLGLARCDGPHVKFEPGRQDSPTPDIDDLLPQPPPSDDFFHILMYFLNNGLSELDGVVLLSSHTTACFSEGCLDSTPSKFDKTWAVELLAWNRLKPDPAPCTPFEFAMPVAQCKATMDTLWLQFDQTKKFLELMVSPATTQAALTAEVRRVIDKVGLTNYRGLLPGVNLCHSTSRDCPGYKDNFAFHNLFATSMYRLIHLVPEVL